MHQRYNIFKMNDTMHTAGRVYSDRNLRTRPALCILYDRYAHGRPGLTSL